MLHVLQVQGEQVEHRKEHAGEEQVGDVGAHPRPVVQEADRYQGIARRPLPRHEGGQGGDTGDHRDDHLGRSPGMIAGGDQPVDDADQPGRAQDGPLEVGPRRVPGPFGPALRHQPKGDQSGEDAHWDIDVEDPAPRGDADQDAGDDGPQGPAEPGHPTEDADGLGPLLGVGEQQGDQAEGGW